ncbi:unnamed protein product [Phytophthora lilii]|uniref:Unnamed protein product n=1 Tax=Phytophthora lilii TaxID=2077276 RepID=A0A9W6WM82_9STRA|nr:unnamed protein product [Phytophthora lilii]
MAEEHPKPPITARFRAFTTSLGFKPSVSRSSSDQSSTPGVPRPASTSSVRSLYGSFTLYLRVHSARNLPAVAQSSYCKLYLGDTPMIGGFGQGKSLVPSDKKNEGNSHQTFHTKVQTGETRGNPEWNEKFQMNVRSPHTEILTIRVKNHVLIYSPAIGACAIHLRQLHLGETIDEWFPLYKNEKASGQIRLQICLQENSPAPAPERRYSQPSEDTIQTLMQKHRELEEARRRELELEQQEKWRKMEEDHIKHVGLQDQIEREGKWRQQCAKRSEPELVEEQQDSDSDLPPSFKNRGMKKEEEKVTQLMSGLNLQGNEIGNQERELKSEVSSGYTVYGANAGDYDGGFPERRTAGFGTIRLSVEELEQVVQNALPSSDSSDASSTEQKDRRQRRDYDNQMHRRRRKAKKHHRRRSSSDDSFSDASSASSTERRRHGKPRKHYTRRSSNEDRALAKYEGALRTKLPEAATSEKNSTVDSVSSNSNISDQNQRQDSEIPVTLSFLPSPSDEYSSSEEEHRRRRRRRAEKARRREKERKRRYKRKYAKSRRDYDSDYSSSSLSSSSLSSSFSSSEEERLRQKLKEKKAKKAKARAMFAESGGSHASMRTPGMQHSNELTSAKSRGIDFPPYMAQHGGQDGDARTQATEGAVSNRPGQNVKQTAATSVGSYRLSTAEQQPVYSSKEYRDYGPDGVGFDEPDQTAMPQYLGQTTKEQTNAELMRSFCF